MHRQRTPALTACVLATVLGLFGAVALGRPEVAAVAVPFALLAVAGVVGAEEPALRAELSAGVDRVLEGDAWVAVLRLTTDVPVPHAEVLVALAGADPVSGSATTHVAGPLTPVASGAGAEGAGARLARVTVASADGASAGWSGPLPAGTTTVAIPVLAGTWGVARLGPVTVRARGPLGLVRWQGEVAPASLVRVLPQPAGLDDLLPMAPRAVAGAHRSRVRAEGFEFADVRPYQPGDRLRAVNWRVSSRRPELWVNLRHPDRSADLVVVVDTFADRPDGRAPWLRQSVRGGWAVALAHLAAHDRVGFLGFGGYPTWVRPAAGQRARYELLDRLLVAHASWTEAPRSVRTLPAAALPPSTDVVAISPLHDERMVAALGELRRRGHPVVAVVVEASPDPVPDGPGWAEAIRLWRLVVDARRDDLADAGVPAVTWPTGAPLSSVLDAVAHARRRAVPPPRAPSSGPTNRRWAG